MGDGTTSVVVLAGEILKEVRELVEQGVSPQTIVKGLRRGSAMAVNKVKEIAVDMIDAAGSEEKKVETLRRLAATAMNSKLIKRNTDFLPRVSTFLGEDFGMGKMADWMISGCRFGPDAGPERPQREVDWCEESYWRWSSGFAFRQRCCLQEDFLVRRF